MNGKIISGNIIMDGTNSIQEGCIVLEGKKIKAIVKNTDPSLEIYKKSGNYQWIDEGNHYILPGMIDVHFHGSVGYDLIDPDQNKINAIGENLVSDGVTAFFASLTVISHEKMLEVLSRFAQIKPQKGAQWLGVHSEGPYLSKDYKALMDETYLRDPNLNEIDEMLQVAQGKLKIMTVAAERKGMDEVIPYLKKQGLTVMLGHSNATAQQATQALSLGATGFTHLYNAMSPLTHRNPGMVASALQANHGYAELIVDCFHVDEEVIRLTYEILGAKRIVLITDAMPGKDMEDGFFEFSKLKAIKKGKTAVVYDTGRIAGSVIGMDEAIENMNRITHCSIQEIVQMACVNPAVMSQCISTKGSLEVGKDGDIVVLDKNLKVLSTYVLGEKAFQL